MPCTAKLGSNPKEYRKHLRDSLDQGFYVAVSSKKKIRTLHLLGQCYLLPTLDYTTFSFLVPRLPSRSLSDQTCKWCAKSGDMNQKSQDSSDCGTATSSSTDDEQERAQSVDAYVVAALSWTRAASNERKFPWCLRGRRQRSESVDAPIVVALRGRELPEDESVDAPASQSRAWTLADSPFWREGRSMDGVSKRTRVGKLHVPFSPHVIITNVLNGPISVAFTKG